MTEYQDRAPFSGLCAKLLFFENGKLTPMLDIDTLKVWRDSRAELVALTYQIRADFH